jgi:hypothetical protein
MKKKDKLIFTRQQMLIQREQMQHDIDCILEGMDDKVVDLVCQVIVDRFNILIATGEQG